VNELKALGIESISLIPATLAAKQIIIRNAMASGHPYVAPDLAGLLSSCGPPTCYLDFEAMMPPIPLYEGTRPYQTIPFQWSLHASDSNGVLRHREFLAKGNSDPRRRFAETLIEGLAAFAGPILVYSGYEQVKAEPIGRRISRSQHGAQCLDHPVGGSVANRARRRLLPRIPL
jgi:hypothetical protein